MEENTAPPPNPPPKNTTTITQLADEYGTLYDFSTAMKESGRITIDIKYMTWFFVLQLVLEKKFYLRKTDLDGFKMLPR